MISALVPLSEINSQSSINTNKNTISNQVCDINIWEDVKKFVHIHKKTRTSAHEVFIERFCQELPYYAKLKEANHPFMTKMFLKSFEILTFENLQQIQLPNNLTKQYQAIIIYGNVYNMDLLAAEAGEQWQSYSKIQEQKKQDELDHEKKLLEDDRKMQEEVEQHNIIKNSPPRVQYRQQRTANRTFSYESKLSLVNMATKCLFVQQSTKLSENSFFLQKHSMADNDPMYRKPTVGQSTPNPFLELINQNKDSTDNKDILGGILGQNFASKNLFRNTISNTIAKTESFLGSLSENRPSKEALLKRLGLSLPLKDWEIKLLERSINNLELKKLLSRMVIKTHMDFGPLGDKRGGDILDEKYNLHISKKAVYYSKDKVALLLQPMNIYKAISILLQDKEFDKKFRYMTDLPIFAHWKDKHLIDQIHILSHRQFTYGNVVYNYKSIVDKIFFVYRGTFEVRISADQMTKKNQEGIKNKRRRDDDSDATSEGLMLKEKKKNEIRIGQVSSGDFFGDYEVFEKQNQRCMKVVCSSSFGELISISRSELFVNCYSLKTMNIMRASHKLKKEHIRQQRVRKKALSKLESKNWKDMPKVDQQNIGNSDNEKEQSQHKSPKNKDVSEIIKEFTKIKKNQDDIRKQELKILKQKKTGLIIIPNSEEASTEDKVEQNWTKTYIKTWDNFFSKIKRVNNIENTSENLSEQYKHIELNSGKSSNINSANFSDDLDQNNSDDGFKAQGDRGSNDHDPRGYFFKGNDIEQSKRRGRAPDKSQPNVSRKIRMERIQNFKKKQEAQLEQKEANEVNKNTDKIIERAMGVDREYKTKFVGDLDIEDNHPIKKQIQDQMVQKQMGIVDEKDQAGQLKLMKSINDENKTKVFDFKRLVLAQPKKISKEKVFSNTYDKLTEALKVTDEKLYMSDIWAIFNKQKIEEEEKFDYKKQKKEDVKKMLEKTKTRLRPEYNKENLERNKTAGHKKRGRRGIGFEEVQSIEEVRVFSSSLVMPRSPHVNKIYNLLKNKLLDKQLNNTKELEVKKVLDDTDLEEKRIKAIAKKAKDLEKAGYEMAIEKSVEIDKSSSGKKSWKKERQSFTVESESFMGIAKKLDDISQIKSDNQSGVGKKIPVWDKGDSKIGIKADSKKGIKADSKKGIKADSKKSGQRDKQIDPIPEKIGKSKSKNRKSPNKSNRLKKSPTKKHHKTSSNKIKYTKSSQLREIANTKKVEESKLKMDNQNKLNNNKNDCLPLVRDTLKSYSVVSKDRTLDISIKSSPRKGSYQNPFRNQEKSPYKRLASSESATSPHYNKYKLINRPRSVNTSEKNKRKRVSHKNKIKDNVTKIFTRDDLPYLASNEDNKLVVNQFQDQTYTKFKKNLDSYNHRLSCTNPNLRKSITGHNQNQKLANDSPFRNSTVKKYAHVNNKSNLPNKDTQNPEFQTVILGKTYNKEGDPEIEKLKEIIGSGDLEENIEEKGKNEKQDKIDIEKASNKYYGHPLKNFRNYDSNMKIERAFDFTKGNQMTADDFKVDPSAIKMTMTDWGYQYMKDNRTPDGFIKGQNNRKIGGFVMGEPMADFFMDKNYDTTNLIEEYQEDGKCQNIHTHNLKLYPRINVKERQSNYIKNLKKRRELEDSKALKKAKLKVIENLIETDTDNLKNKDLDDHIIEKKEAYEKERIEAEEQMNNGVEVKRIFNNTIRVKTSVQTPFLQHRRGNSIDLTKRRKANNINYLELNKKKNHENKKRGTSAPGIKRNIMMRNNLDLDMALDTALENDSFYKARVGNESEEKITDENQELVNHENTGVIASGEKPKQTEEDVLVKTSRKKNHKPAKKNKFFIKVERPRYHN